MKKALILGIFSLVLLTATTVMASNDNHCRHNCNAYPSVTPTVMPTVTPTPIVEVEPSVTPTSTPEVTLTPAPEVHLASGAPTCNDEKPKFAPTVTYAQRSGTDLLTKWTTTDTTEFIIYYGPTGKDLNWNTGRVKGQEKVIGEVHEMVDVVACSVSQCGQLNCSARKIDP